MNTLDKAMPSIFGDAMEFDADANRKMSAEEFQSFAEASIDPETGESPYTEEEFRYIQAEFTENGQQFNQDMDEAEKAELEMSVTRKHYKATAQQDYDKKVKENALLDAEIAEKHLENVTKLQEAERANGGILTPALQSLHGFTRKDDFQLQPNGKDDKVAGYYNGVYATSMKNGKAKGQSASFKSNAENLVMGVMNHEKLGKNKAFTRAQAQEFLTSDNPMQFLTPHEDGWWFDGLDKRTMEKLVDVANDYYKPLMGESSQAYKKRVAETDAFDAARTGGAGGGKDGADDKDAPKADEVANLKVDTAKTYKSELEAYKKSKSIYDTASPELRAGLEADPQFSASMEKFKDLDASEAKLKEMEAQDFANMQTRARKAQLDSDVEGVKKGRVPATDRTAKLKQNLDRIELEKKMKPEFKAKADADKAQAESLNKIEQKNPDSNKPSTFVTPDQIVDKVVAVVKDVAGTSKEQIINMLKANYDLSGIAQLKNHLAGKKRDANEEAIWGAIKNSKEIKDFSWKALPRAEIAKMEVAKENSLIADKDSSITKEDSAKLKAGYDKLAKTGKDPVFKQILKIIQENDDDMAAEFLYKNSKARAKLHKIGIDGKAQMKKMAEWARRVKQIDVENWREAHHPSLRPTQSEAVKGKTRKPTAGELDYIKDL